MGEWAGSDRRNHVRASIAATVKITKKSTLEEQLASVRNIGVGGICISLAKDIGLFSEVALEIKFKEGQKAAVHCDGKVVWLIKEAGAAQLGFDAGIEFVKLKEEEKQRIVEVVQQWSQKQGYSR
jgi:hypothetical protein